MKSMARFISLIICCAMLASAATAFAGDNAFRDIFEDAFYGGAAGALVGAALLAFTKKPANHLDYLGYGAASGVLVGTVYGVAKSARSLAQIDNGIVKFAMPTVIPDLSDSPATRQTNITWRASLLRGTFW
jgi:ABC-type Fe3+-siderophore transport system permease subunit